MQTTVLTPTLYDHLEQEILPLPSEQLPPLLHFLKTQHSLRVIRTTERLRRAEVLSQSGTLAIKTKALLQYTGCLYSEEDHEKYSCEIPYDDQIKNSDKKNLLEPVCEPIPATRIPHDPESHPDWIICDADLSYPDEADFNPIGESIRQKLMPQSKLKSDNQKPSPTT